MKEVLTLETALAVLLGGLAIACAIRAFISVRARRRCAWNRRFTDARFSPRMDEIRKQYAEFEAPTYLRTRAEEDRLTPRILRRQAGDV